MPDFNPKVISWNYNRSQGFAPNTQVVFDRVFGIRTNSYLDIAQKPDWLLISQEANEPGTNYRVYKVSLVPEYANVLPIGDNSAEVKFTYFFRVSNRPRTQTRSFTVNIKVSEYEKLQVDKNILLFNYTRGNALPASQFLGIKTPRNFQIISDSQWITTSPPSGAGNTSVAINVDIDLAQQNLNLGTLLVDDGDSTKSVEVQLLIRGTEAPEDNQSFTPEVLEFSGISGSVTPEPKTVSITSTQAIAVTADTAWLSLSETNFAAGTNTLTVTIANANTLPPGSYPGKITLTSEFGVDVVTVLLRILETQTSGITSNSFLFADDRNSLVLTNIIDNAEALIEFETQATREFKTYTKRIPFYQGVATSIIGLEATILLFPEVVPAISTQVFEPVKPLQIAMNIFDKTLDTFTKTLRTSYQNIKVINGKTPKVTGKLSYIPAAVTVPVEGVLAFSFRTSEAVPLTDIEITGAITNTITPPVNNSGLYTCLIKLSDFNLAPGNLITITAPGIDLTARVSDSINTQPVQLIWENEWQMPEVFNLTGTVEAITEEESETVNLTRSGKQYTAVIEVKDAASFAVNTGNIYSEAEARWLGSVLRSKKTWLQIGTERIEVIRTFKKLSVSRSRRYNLSYDLTFDAAIR